MTAVLRRYRELCITAVTISRRRRNRGVTAILQCRSYPFTWLLREVLPSLLARLPGAFLSCRPNRRRFGAGSTYFFRSRDLHDCAFAKPSHIAAVTISFDFEVEA